MINAPFGAADVQTPAYSATLAVTVTNQLTILEPAILTGDCTLNVTIDSQVKAGAVLLLVQAATTDGMDVTFGTGIDAPNLVGVTGKTKSQSFMYDGVSFKAMGAMVQLD